MLTGGRMRGLAILNGSSLASIIIDSTALAGIIVKGFCT
jgi:hypothetical protein